MKSIFLILFSAILILSLSNAAFAGKDNKNAGTSAFNFLKIQIGARPMAMGGAFTGVANDEASLYYNPAGIASIEGSHYIFDYHNNVFDMQSGFLGYIHQLGNKSRLAFQINYLNYGEFLETDANGIEIGTFGGSDFLFAATYATQINPDISVGLTAKFISEKIDEYSSTGLAVDIGGKFTLVKDYYDNTQRVSAGLMIQNLGAQLSTFSSNGEKMSLPTIFRAGGAAFLKGLPFMIAADVIYPTDNDIYASIGLETTTLKPLYLRAGWTSFGSNYETNGSTGLAGLSFGFGIDYKKMQFSYTLVPKSDLGTSHRITLTGGIN